MCPHVEVVCDGTSLLHSPAAGLWAVAMDWQDRWPTQWCHGGPDTIEQVGEWTILRGQVVTPAGVWKMSDSYRPEKGTIKCIRRFVWTGEKPAERCTLAVQFVAPSVWTARSDAWRSLLRQPVGGQEWTGTCLHRSGWRGGFV